MNKFKRLSNHVSPFTHRVVNDLFVENGTKKVQSNMAFLTAKKLLADLPVVPTSERVYELAQQIQMGLLDDYGPLEKLNKNKEAWSKAVEITKNYLGSIGILLDLRG